MTEFFTSVYTVTIGDINYGGHLGNDKALVVFQDARISFLKELGASEIDIGDGCGIIMVESGVRYHSEVFLHDELLVSLTVSEIKGKKFTLDYTVQRRADEVEVLSGFTSFLTFDYQIRKVVKLPPAFKKQLEAYPAH